VGFPVVFILAVLTDDYFLNFTLTIHN
jgi:hypothetical protein